MWGAGPLAIAAQALRGIGVAAAVYATTSLELIDIRGILRAVVGNALFIAFLSLVIIGGIGAWALADNRLPDGQKQLAVVAVVIALAIVYQRLQPHLKNAVSRAVLASGYDTAEIVKGYSQRIANLLDIGDLAVALGITLAQAVQSTRLGLLLFSLEGNGLRTDVMIGAGKLPTHADQTSVALKNARLVSNLRALNEGMRLLNQTLEARNEQLREMDKVKTDFITIASHELRTPLTQILGFADLLKMMSEADSIAGSEISPITDSVLKASNRLGEVVNQMLDVSQLDVDAMQLKMAETTVDAVLRAAVAPFTAAIKERRLTLAVQNIRTLPPIQADLQRLGQAFSHIIGNAVKFTPDGGSIEVRGRHLVGDSKEPNSIEIVVADSGVGINNKYLELIFEKFFRVGSTSLHSTGTTKFMGAGPGLGLPIAKGIIGGHGGRVWAESPGFDKDKYPGTKIFVVLPIHPPAVTGKGVPAFIGLDAPV
ncbi:MAG: HAMP domain-containing histidine kinase [Chloroflexi bacterium]|nr:HAMP domain-containing histidine kinase [Chloroflexota bacterium]